MVCSSDEYKEKYKRELWISRKKPFRDRNNVSRFLKKLKHREERNRWKQNKEETYKKFKGDFW